MISLKELNPTGGKLNEEQEKNIKILHERINKIRALYGKPMTVTSGVRTMDDHLRIYKDIAKKKGVPFDQSKVPMGSQHLKGAAVDIADSDGALDKWCVEHEKELAEIGLWIEHPNDTPGWTHFQIYPPKSGSRFFHP